MTRMERAWREYRAVRKLLMTSTIWWMVVLLAVVSADHPIRVGAGMLLMGHDLIPAYLAFIMLPLYRLGGNRI